MQAQRVETLTVFDPPIVDRSFKLPEEVLEQVLSRYNLKRGKKQSVDDDVTARIAAEVAPYGIGVEGGGSGFTFGRIMKRLLPNRISVQQAGILGNDALSNNILKDFDNTKIHLFPRPHLVGANAASAVSIVLVDQKGERTYASSSGSFNDLTRIVPNTDQIIEQTNILHLLGTNRMDVRLGWKYVDQLLTQRWNAGKELWLNLPTKEEFAKQNAEYFRWLITSANLVMGNMDELKWAMGVDKKQDALEKVQNLLAINVLKSEGRLTSGREPVAFITDEGNPAYIVTPAKSTPSKPGFMDEKEKVNVGGAGDTCLAGFAAGYYTGQDHEKSARIGHTLARQTMKQDAPCLENPRQVLNDNEPALLRSLDRRWVPTIVGKLEAA